MDNEQKRFFKRPYARAHSNRTQWSGWVPALSASAMAGLVGFLYFKRIAKGLVAYGYNDYAYPFVPNYPTLFPHIVDVALLVLMVGLLVVSGFGVAVMQAGLDSRKARVVGILFFVWYVAVTGLACLGPLVVL